MSPKGCLSTVFLVLIGAWSLFIGGLLAAGWLGAELIEFFTRLVLADAAGARQAADGIVGFLRALGFGVFVAIWAVGAAAVVLVWVLLLRGTSSAETTLERERIEIDIRDWRSRREMKDVTPPRRDGGGPPEIPPPR